jgi:serine/threonine protein kinase
VHSNGVIHRDIKPANILLAPTTLPHQRFRAKLSDFGIAHFVDASRVTMPGLFLGTASYVSPEQARGVEPAAPADIYALGLTLLEALTGKPAFAGSPLEVVSARLHRDPHIPAWLGLEWSALLTQMTDRDPSRRLTAIEVAAAARALPATPHRPSDSTVSTGALDVVISRSPIAGPSAQTEELTEANATLLLPEVGTAAEEQPEETPRASSRRTHLRRGLGGAVVVIALVVIGLIAIPRGGTSGDAPVSTPAPTLPSLAPPLDADMRDLLDQVGS